MKFLFKVGKHNFVQCELVDLLVALTKKSKTEIKRLVNDGAVDTYVYTDNHSYELKVDKKNE